MGGGLAFLNKKSWHTGGHRNRETVWKREQEDAVEKAKVKELQQQIEEEREQQELERLNDQRGRKKKQERLDFMYNTPLANKELDANKDAYLLGEKKVTDATLASTSGGNPNMLGGEQSQCERVASLPSAYTEDTTASRNEVWARMQNDPLFAIRRQQQRAVEKIKRNPVAMQRIRNQVKQEVSADPRVSTGDGAGDDGKRGSGGHRSHRHRRHRHKSGSSRRSGEDRGDDSKKRHRKRHRRASKSRSRSRSPTRPTEAAPPPSSDYGLAATTTSLKNNFSARDKIASREREQAEAEKERERRNKAWSYGGRTKHATGRLSEEELRKKREEMMQAGSSAHKQKTTVLRREEEEDRREGNQQRGNGAGEYRKNFYRM